MLRYLCALGKEWSADDECGSKLNIDCDLEVLKLRMERMKDDNSHQVDIEVILVGVDEEAQQVN